MRKSIVESLLAVGLIVVAGYAAAEEVLPPVAPTVAETSAPAAVSSDAAEQLDFAAGLLGRKMYKMAAAEYEKFITTYPDRPETAHALFMIGETAFFMKDYRDAVARYTDYLARFPAGADAPRAHLRIAASRIELKEYDGAIVEAAPIAAASYSTDLRAEAFYLTGLGKAEAGRKAEGIDDLTASLALGDALPFAAPAAYQLGRLFFAAKDYDRALDAFKKTAALSPDPEVKDLALLGCGQIARDRADYTAAADAFREIAARPGPPDETKDKAIIGLLDALYELKRYKEMEEAYLARRNDFQAVSLKLEAALLLIQGYSRDARFDDALTSLETILADPGLTEADREKAFLEKITVLILAKRYDDAAVLIGEKTACADMPRYRYLKAELSYYRGNFDEAAREYDAVAATYTTSPLAAEALYGMAHVALEKKEKGPARDLFVKLATVFPDAKRSREALYTAIVLDSELGLHADGVAHAKLYLARYPGHETERSVKLLLGRFYTDLKEPGNAIGAYEAFATAYPDDPKIADVWFLLGFNNAAQGAREASNAWYAKITPIAGGYLYRSAQKNIAQNLTALGKETAAAETLDKLMVEHPGDDLDIDTCLWVAKRYLDARRYQDALRVTALAESRPDAAGKKTAILYYKAEAARSYGDYDTALAGYEASAAEEKGQGEFTGAAFIGAGLCYAAKNDLAAAQGAFEKAIASSADDTVTMRGRYYLGDALDRQGKTAEAARTFMMVAILYDDDRFVPDALYRAAVAFGVSGMREESMKAYADFLERFPKDERVAEVQAALAREHHAT